MAILSFGNRRVAHTLALDFGGMRFVGVNCLDNLVRKDFRREYQEFNHDIAICILGHTLLQ
jgi:hypothetical protein